MLLFLDIGTGELILILLVVFVVMGPKQLPEIARTLGKTINEMKRASAGFKNEINKEVQRLDRETRLNDFISQRAAPAAPSENAEVASTKKSTAANPVAAAATAETALPTSPAAEEETGRVERRI